MKSSSDRLFMNPEPTSHSDEHPTSSTESALAKRPIIVQKFGGTSVADTSRIVAAAEKALAAHQAGNQVVMVVSAMGKNTDLLIGLAREINSHPPAREMDMLLSTGEQVSVALMAMALDRLGAKAVSLTGGQIGIHTDRSHTRARILSIATDRVRELLDEGNIVIAAGFQGVDDRLDITTLGRGGSDTTAVALAAVLNAASCEIYTDVDGVFTTDPRLLPAARQVSRVSYTEMLELASLGAGVMHSRSIEFAQKFDVPIVVRNSQENKPGSLIWRYPESPTSPVFGAALTRNETRVTLDHVPDSPGALSAIVSAIADAGVTLDMIVQTMAQQGRVQISFSVPTEDIESTGQALDRILPGLGAEQTSIDQAVAKLSVVGSGMAHQVGVARRMFQALAQCEAPVHLVTTSEIKISALLDQQAAERALSQVHDEFELHRVPADAGSPLPSESDRPPNVTSNSSSNLSESNLPETGGPPGEFKFGCARRSGTRDFPRTAGNHQPAARSRHGSVVCRFRGM